MDYNGIIQGVFYGGVVVAGVAYLYNQMKRGKDDYIQDTIRNMKELIESQDGKISDLSDKLTKGTARIDDLEAEVSHLKRVNTDYQNIIRDALSSYFKNNPDTVAQLSALVKKSKI